MCCYQVLEMDHITHEEYDRIMDEHDELINLILTRTKELANIMYNRDPNGTCYETDFDINDDGSLLVQFEEHWCGETDMDSYRLPLEFVFSEEYRKNYRTLIEEERHEKEHAKLQQSIKEEEKRRKSEEDYDKAEYERLKEKYGGIE